VTLHNPAKNGKKRSVVPIFTHTHRNRKKEFCLFCLPTCSIGMLSTKRRQVDERRHLLFVSSRLGLVESQVTEKRQKLKNYK
jgi:hypothetical protein